MHRKTGLVPTTVTPFPPHRFFQLLAVTDWCHHCFTCSSINVTSCFKNQVNISEANLGQRINLFSVWHKFDWQICCATLRKGKKVDHEGSAHLSACLSHVSILLVYICVCITCIHLAGQYLFGLYLCLYHMYLSGWSVFVHLCLVCICVCNTDSVFDHEAAGHTLGTSVIHSQIAPIWPAGIN